MQVGKGDAVLRRPCTIGATDTLFLSEQLSHVEMV